MLCSRRCRSASHSFRVLGGVHSHTLCSRASWPATEVMAQPAVQMVVPRQVPSFWLALRLRSPTPGIVIIEILWLHRLLPPNPYPSRPSRVKGMWQRWPRRRNIVEAIQGNERREQRSSSTCLYIACDWEGDHTGTAPVKERSPVRSEVNKLPRSLWLWPEPNHVTSATLMPRGCHLSS